MYKMVIGTMFRNEAYYLKEWIDHHIMIGVEHFYLYNDSSTDNWEEVLKPYIDSGIVEVFFWEVIRSAWTSSQVLAFHDIGQKYGHLTEWLTFIDIDEFILPIKNKLLIDCLNEYFSDASAVYISWRSYGTSHITIKPYDTILDKLTMSSERLHSRNASGKTIFRTSCASDYNLMWSAHFVPLDKGIYNNGDCEFIPFNETNSDIMLDGRHRDNVIILNHYCHRDDNYFFSYRLHRDNTESLMMEHYDSFNKVKNTAMIDYIKEFHLNN